jgi:hypothetical protein
VPRREPTPRLPGDVQARIDRGEAPDPMWYVGRLWPSALDVLHAGPGELERFRRLAAERGEVADVGTRTERGSVDDG